MKSFIFLKIFYLFIFFAEGVYCLGVDFRDTFLSPCVSIYPKLGVIFLQKPLKIHDLPDVSVWRNFRWMARSTRRCSDLIDSRTPPPITHGSLINCTLGRVHVFSGVGSEIGRPWRWSLRCSSLGKFGCRVTIHVWRKPAVHRLLPF